MNYNTRQSSRKSSIMFFWPWDRKSFSGWKGARYLAAEEETLSWDFEKSDHHRSGWNANTVLAEVVFARPVNPAVL